MSRVSGVVLVLSTLEEADGVGDDADMPPENLPAINAWLSDRRVIGSLVCVQEAFGGSKHPQAFVAGAGLNYLPEDDFAAFVIGLPWRCPQNVVLVIQPEDGPTRTFRPDVAPRSAKTRP